MPPTLRSPTACKMRIREGLASKLAPRHFRKPTSDGYYAQYDLHYGREDERGSCPKQSKSWHSEDATENGRAAYREHQRNLYPERTKRRERIPQARRHESNSAS